MPVVGHLIAVVYQLSCYDFGVFGFHLPAHRNFPSLKSPPKATSVHPIRTLTSRQESHEVERRNVEARLIPIYERNAVIACQKHVA